MEQTRVRVVDGRADRPRPKPRPRAGWLVGGLLIGLLVGYVFSPSLDRGVSGSGAESETGVGLLDGPSSAEPIIALGARIPNFAGSLVATVGVRDFELLIWPADVAVPESINIGGATSPAGPNTSPIIWDASGSAYAFLRNLDGSETVLYVGSEAEYVPLVRRVMWFAWHATEPSRLAWTVASDGGVGQQLFVAEVAGSASSEPVPSVTVPATERLVAWDETGFVLGFRDGLGGEWIRRIDGTGREIGRARGTLVAMRGNGELLLTRRADGDSSFYQADPTLGALTALQWAPPEAVGRVRPATWASDGRIAFIARDERSNVWRLEIYEPDGESSAVQELPGQVWDVRWSPDGRFVVMPGFDNRGGRGHSVFAYDSLEALLYEIEFDDRVASVLIRP